MDTGRISTRYAKAIFEVAKEHGSDDKVYQEMCSVSSSFALVPSLRKTISNPSLSDSEQEQLILTAAGNEQSPVCEDFKNFLKVVILRRRTTYIQTISLVYQDIYRKSKNIVVGKLTTASVPSPEIVEQIKKAMIKVTNMAPDSTIEFQQVVDPAIIGGFQLQIGSDLLDASISSEMRDMKKALIEKIQVQS